MVKHRKKHASGHKHSAEKSHSGHTSHSTGHAAKHKDNNLKLYASWSISAAIITILLFMVIFSCNGDDACTSGVTGNAVKDEFIFLKSDACTDACAEMEPVAKEYAEKAGLEYRKVNYPQPVPMPGYFILTQDKTSVPSGIENEAALAIGLCEFTENEAICDEAESAMQGLAEQEQEAQQQQYENIPKVQKPVVDVFVMSHCPYGTQIEKGLLPVAEALGDKIELNVRFVDYAMHSEVELVEQINQYCIQKEQPAKYYDYLACFLKEGDTDACLSETGIDTDMLSQCFAETDAEYNIMEMFADQSTWVNGRFPVFPIDQELNDKYGVRGSPHLVINEETVSASRDSASLLAAICSGFTDQPAECNLQLSSTPPSPGFGYEGSGADTAATCG